MIEHTLKLNHSHDDRKLKKNSDVVKNDEKIPFICKLHQQQAVEIKKRTPM